MGQEGGDPDSSHAGLGIRIVRIVGEHHHAVPLQGFDLCLAEGDVPVNEIEGLGHPVQRGGRIDGFHVVIRPLSGRQGDQ